MGIETNTWPANGGTAGGVSNSYGARTTNGKFGGSETSDNIIRRAVWDFNFDDLPAGATNNLGFVIPANSTIVSATVLIDTAFATTTGSMTVGLEQADGTDIGGVNGLVLVTDATEALIETDGARIVGTGALINRNIGAAAGELQVAVAGTPTAGHARVTVEYVLNS